nr:PREDICTED: uncharacterized protein LOC107077800 isoform X1 [Lepisosteus oculatus]XP_015206222.1 PREDICTED: uncharacterized protein LOC107077800 isoform X2 [Lepisosteus oculatus]XP_015206224.1 PREDICTED: uncharacterized protein LOC107077800 isoform X3 [Lepisosteus oculatus]
MELNVFWTKTENVTIGCPAKIRLDDNLHILDSKTNSIKWLCSESHNTTENNTKYPTTVYKIYWQEAENIDRKEIRHKYTYSELSFIKNLTNSPSLLKAFDKLKEKVPKQIDTNVQYGFIGIYNRSNEKCNLVDFCNLKKANLNNEGNAPKIHTEEYICKKADIFLKYHKISADDMVVIFTKNSPCIVNKGKHSCMDLLHTYCKKWYDDYGIPSVIGFDQYYGFTGYKNYFSHLQNDEHLFHCLLSGTSKNCEHCKNNYSSKKLQQAHDLPQNANLILTIPDSSKFLKRMFKPLKERKKHVNDEKYITLPTIYEIVENIKTKTEGLTNYKEYLNIEDDITRTYPGCMKTEFHKVWMLYIAHITKVAAVKHMDQKLKKNIFYAFLKHVEGEQYYTPFWCPLN